MTRGLTKEEMLEQIKFASSALWDDEQTLDYEEAFYGAALAAETLRRLSPPSSFYAQGIPTPDKWGDDNAMQKLRGLLRALAFALKRDAVHDVAELAHASFSSDILGQAEELLNHKFKDPAAVMIGSALEAHLRNLCEKFNLSVWKENGAPAKASELTIQLKKASVYGNSDDKQVSAWLSIRNSAAHGKYNEYEFEQVRIMLDGVRLFFSRYPA